MSREEFQNRRRGKKSVSKIYGTGMMDLLEDSSRVRKCQQSPVTGSQPLASILQLVLFALILGNYRIFSISFCAVIYSEDSTRKKKAKTEDRVILGEKLTADQNASNLFSEAEKMAREGDLRGAIRKGYIALLCELSDRKIIGLSQHKTNRDYLRDVRSKENFIENMNGLTLNFERHWYGFDSAENTDWEEFKSGYKKAVNSKQ